VAGSHQFTLGGERPLDGVRLRRLASATPSVSAHVFQIVFNRISAAELSKLDTLAQLELLDQFKVDADTLENLAGQQRFGKIERSGRTLYRYRARDYRIYFEVVDGNVVVHRVLHKNTLDDFRYRSKLPLSEDEAVGKSKVFWNLIEEGERAGRV
jgi:mRNA-degrading endonuclease RelE of RelBE toxin-antitoxin system